MEKNSENLEFLKYRKGKKEMTDVLLARELIRDIGGPGPTSTILYNAYLALSRKFPHRENARDQWSARRLKAWWYGESQDVLHREMVELYEAALAKKAEQELIREARNDHRRFLEKTARLRAFLEHADEDFFGPQIAGLGGEVGNGDRSRDSGDR